MEHDLTRTWDLVRQAQRGDCGALNRLFARYYERVHRAVRARIGKRLRQHLETEDILQPAFAKAFENFARFEMRDEGSLLHWLAEYAHGQIRDAADRVDAKKRKPPAARAAGGDGTGSHLHPVAPTRSPSERAAANEDQLAIEDCMDELPEPQRRVILLRDFDGLPWGEVARVLGKNTDSAARELHRRALLQLAQRLAARGRGPAAAPDGG